MIEVENGTKLYFAGDTCVFGDMALIGRIYEPDVAVLPIGGHFTMDPREAAVAIELLGVGRVHPVPLRDVPAPRRDARGVPRAADDRLRDPRARARASTVTGLMRERWFGATGRRVPEIVVEGEIELGEALVLDDVADEERLREAHAAGRPVVVRAADPESVARALARPEVACVLVPADRRDLLDLDLRRITYG